MRYIPLTVLLILLLYFGVGAFPRGVFVAQDDHNEVGNQNFKLVPRHLIVGAAGR